MVPDQNKIITYNVIRKYYQVYQWGHSRRFNACSEYFRRLFGSRIKIINDVVLRVQTVMVLKVLTDVHIAIMMLNDTRTENQLPNMGRNLFSYGDTERFVHTLLISIFSNTYAPLTTLKDTAAFNYPGDRSCYQPDLLYG